MERNRNVFRRGPAPWILAAAALVLAPPAAQAQFGGGPANYTFHVVDQNGRPLDGSIVRVEGWTSDMTTPATAELASGPQLVVIEPAVLGPMLPGGSVLPGSPNGLSRNEFIFLDPAGGDVVIQWRTVDVAVSIVDQGGITVPGARWGFAGDGASYAPGTITLPLTDESVHMGMTGPSVAGWQFDVRAAFDGAAIDLVRGEVREATDAMAPLAFGWRQTSCTMGVVDATDTPIRGATWTVFGRTFQAGDAITLPATDEALYPDLSGAMAAGLPVYLFTNTAYGSGDVTFEVGAAGSLSPAFADVNGGAFGLRCGIAAFPPLTTGSLAVSVTADGAAYPGAQVTVVDATGAIGAYATGLDGSFQVGDVPPGALSITLAVPSGYHAVTPASGSFATLIEAGEALAVSFAIAADPTGPPPIVNAPEPYNYWRREVAAALRGSGRRDESPADMALNFPQAIFDGFARHATDPVVVEGVTQVDPDGTGPAAARGLELADMDATLDPGGNDPLHGARRELLVVLLNVVSGRLSLELVVDGTGTTLDQEIRRLAAMINDGQPDNDPVARAAAERINGGHAGRRMAAGGIGTHDDVSDRFDAVSAEGSTTGTTLLATRVGTSQRIAFTLANAGRVTLDVYDVNGRRQARLYAGDAPAGETVLQWSGNGRRGIYFARLITERGAQSVKLMVAP